MIWILIIIGLLLGLSNYAGMITINVMGARDYFLENKIDHLIWRIPLYGVLILTGIKTYQWEKFDQRKIKKNNQRGTNAK